MRKRDTDDGGKGGERERGSRGRGERRKRRRRKGKRSAAEEDMRTRRWRRA